MKRLVLALFLLLIAVPALAIPPAPPGIPANCDGTTCTTQDSIAIPSGKTLTVQTPSGTAEAASKGYVDGKKEHFAPFRLLNPTASDDYPIQYVSQATTLTSVKAVCVGGTSVSFTLQQCDADSTSNCADRAAEFTVTCGTLATATIATPAIAADKWLKVLTGTVTGAVSYAIISIEGTVP